MACLWDSTRPLPGFWHLLPLLPQVDRPDSLVGPGSRNSSKHAALHTRMASKGVFLDITHLCEQHIDPIRRFRAMRGHVIPDLIQEFGRGRRWDICRGENCFLLNTTPGIGTSFLLFSSTLTLALSAVRCLDLSASSKTTYLMNSPQSIKKVACPKRKPCVNDHRDDVKMGEDVAVATAKVAAEGRSVVGDARIVVTAMTCVAFSATAAILECQEAYQCQFGKAIRVWKNNAVFLVPCW